MDRGAWQATVHGVAKNWYSWAADQKQGPALIQVDLVSKSTLTLEKEMATHSSTRAWKIPWKEKPGRLQAVGSQKSRTRLSDFAFTFCNIKNLNLNYLPLIVHFMLANSSVLAHLTSTARPGCRLSYGKPMFRGDWGSVSLKRASLRQSIQILLTGETCESNQRVSTQHLPGQVLGQSPRPVHWLEPGFALSNLALWSRPRMRRDWIMAVASLPVCSLLPSLASTWLPDWSFSNKHQIRSKPCAMKI